MDDVASRARQLISRIRKDGRPAKIAWNTAFTQDAIGGAVLADAFLRLHNEEDYELAIEGIEAALRNDHAQPWMYDVLALEMTLAKRPQKQIDRVLLSRIDFTGGDPAQMLLTAAMLSRLNAWDQALGICREAVRRNPLQPAVWELARSIALKSKNSEEIIWACAGTIQNVWEGDFELLHAECRTELEELAASLQSSDRPELASKTIAALESASRRDLRIVVTWAGDADLDLIVQEPNNQRSSYRQRMTTNGGALIRQGHGGKSRSSATQTEEYVISRAPNGEYVGTIRYISGRVIGGKVRVKVTRYEGSAAEKTQTLTPTIGKADPKFRIQINRGRGQ